MSDDTACISSIFSQCDFNDDEVVVIRAFPGRLDIRKPAQVSRPVPPKRGLITGFSKKSRLNFMKMMAALEWTPNIWQDFTFSDDVMEGLTVHQRHKKAAAILKEFKRQVEKIYPDAWGFWKKESTERKSGSLSGQEIPHYHMMMFMPGIVQAGYEQHCRKLSRIWVQVTGTKNPKALEVSTNNKSYRWINDAKHAMVYVSKYVAKSQDFNDGISRGRFWGTIGKPPLADGFEMFLTHREWHVMKRVFRRLFKKNKRMVKTLSRRFVNGFCFVGLPTILQVLEYVQQATAPPF